LKKGRKKNKNQLNVFVKINEQIRYPEARVLNAEGDNLGVMKISDALAKARTLNLDLIEIS
jgi:translation initiation factor IF-3